MLQISLLLSMIMCLFFVISSNLTIRLSLFLAVCGVTCFVCNFRNPCTISAPKRRKKNGKGVRNISSKDPSNTHNKKKIFAVLNDAPRGD